jgi:two-component system nitrate/nitrite response regulator NarL
MEASTPFYRTVSVCETQPLTIRGLKNLLEETPDFRLGSWHGTVAEWMMSSLADQTDILIIDKALGAQVLLDALAHIPASGKKTAGVVIWGVSLNEAEALRLLQAGARGILRKSAELDAVLACLRMVAQGGSWMQETVFRESGNVAETHLHTELTPREQQVLELVEQGFKNREIAAELGIRPGTVKIHLKHIFEKTGIHGRHGLALTGLRQKGVIPRMIS